MTNEERWMEHYCLLKKYVSEHGHLPDKKKVENRGLLNWWKYNKKRAKQGLLPQGRRIKIIRIKTATFPIVRH